MMRENGVNNFSIRVPKAGDRRENPTSDRYAALMENDEEDFGRLGMSRS